jgi:hypothetical protein
MDVCNQLEAQKQLYLQPHRCDNFSSRKNCCSLSGNNFLLKRENWYSETQ